MTGLSTLPDTLQPHTPWGTPTVLHITAAAGDAAPTIEAAGHVTRVTAAAGSRTITGAFLPYGVVGNTSAGPTIVDAGALTVPTDLRRVKLLVQHDTYSAAVGVMSSYDDGETEAHGSWTLPEGDADADAALAKASSGLRDGLSVGLRLLDYSWDDQGVLLVHAAELNEVSLVTIPAWSDARVAASRKELHQMPTNVPATERPAPDVEAQATAPASQTVEAAQGRQEAAPVEAAAAPVEASAPSRQQGLSLQAAGSIVMDELRAGNLGGLEAALGEVTLNTGDLANGGEGMARPQWVDEVWTASNTRRPLIEALGTPKPLTAIKVYGWKWVESPEVSEADLGSKKPIEGNTWETTTVDSEAQDFAGGWDVARKLIDLGAPGIVETAFVKATDSYKAKSEAWLVRTVLAEATSLGEQASVTAMLTAIGVKASALGSQVSFVLFSPTVWAEFTSLTEADVPWWLRSQGAINLGTVAGSAGGVTFASSPSLTGRQFLAGDTNAVTFYEVNPPIRVRAENIGQGGVDLGVFGYAAAIVNDPRAVFTGTVAAYAAAARPVTVEGVVQTQEQPSA